MDLLYLVRSSSSASSLDMPSHLLLCPQVVAFVLCALAAKPVFLGVSATFAFIKGMGGSNRFEKSIDKYNKLQNDGDTSLDARNANYADLVVSYSHC